MNICPICLFVNSPEASSCVRCAKHQFKAGASTAVADPPEQVELDLPASKCLGDQSTIRSEASIVFTKPSHAIKLAEVLRRGDTPPPVQGIQGVTPIKILITPKLEVVRGEKLGVTYVVLEGKNIMGRTVHQPVDIDLTGQEPVERVWTSRQHACIHFDGRTVLLEDMNSLNGTFVNRSRLFPGQQRILHPNDIVQVGTVQLKLVVSAEKEGH